jgi:hypothetical protein
MALDLQGTEVFVPWVWRESVVTPRIFTIMTHNVEKLEIGFYKRARASKIDARLQPMTPTDTTPDSFPPKHSAIPYFNLNRFET